MYLGFQVFRMWDSMEKEKKKNKKAGKLSQSQKDEIYKDEHKKYKKKLYNEMMERAIILLGSTWIGLYVIASSIIFGVISAMYVTIISKELVIDAFIDHPVGMAGNYAFMGITMFCIWFIFGAYGIFLFLEAGKRIKGKEKKYMFWRRK